MSDGVRGAALVVGGTGMLADAVAALVRSGRDTYVVGRTEGKFARLRQAVRDRSDRMRELRVDYDDLHRFQAVLDDTLAISPICLVIVWMRQRSVAARRALYGRIAAQQIPVDWYDVIGTIGGRTLAYPVAPLIRPHVVLLGHRGEGDHFRWLTNEEISAGVLGAVRSGDEQTVVGDD